MTPSNALSVLPKQQPLPQPKLPDDNERAVKRAGLIAAAIALVVILMLPSANGLPRAGQVMLAILAFAVIV